MRTTEFVICPACGGTGVDNDSDSVCGDCCGMGISEDFFFTQCEEEEEEDTEE